MASVPASPARDGPLVKPPSANFGRVTSVRLNPNCFPPRAGTQSGTVKLILFSVRMIAFTTFTTTPTIPFTNPMIPSTTGSTTGNSLPITSTTVLMAFTKMVPTKLTTVESSGITAGMP